MTVTRTKQFDAINPATDESFMKLPDFSLEEVKAVISSARKAFDQGPWKNYFYAERGIYLKKIAQLIRDHARELADLEVSDVGKTSKHANFIDVPTAAECFDYFSNVAVEEKINKVDAPVVSKTVYEPRGVVAAICSYNYPMIYAAWKIAPAMIAGNTIILKPSPLASASINRFKEIIQEAGLPEGVINIITTTSDEAAIELVRSSDVDMISFTGSSKAGSLIMAEAAKTNKKVILELGGKSPTIVFDDANFDAALGGALSAAFMNQGQMCTAGSRLFLQEGVYDSFLEKLVKRVKSLKVGSPTEATTEFGPVTSKEQRNQLLKVIEQAISDGAELACGGKAPDLKGSFIEPTILTNVSNDMTIAREECFGPVLSVIKFKKESDVISMANDSDYGLAASVWTKDQEKGERVAQALECGTVWVNTYGSFFNEVPFGGYKQSGFGRELGEEGLKAYMQSKHICIDQTPGGMPLAASWF